ncbi:MAG: amidase [Betaproteobacteria bacterium]|nr:amidase [Betaproteobacteria bacterium]
MALAHVSPQIAYAHTPLHALPLREAARRIAIGDLSSERYTRALLARIEELDAQVQAWAWLDPAHALACAGRLDGRRAAGSHLGPLHGLPIGVKDILLTRAIPTRMGSAVYEHFVPEHSAEIVDRLEAAGAFTLGKTVTTEFAFMVPNKTHNPWNFAHTPGGSSSGSAAAVACGMVAGALATQTNGSVIRPAAFCGVVGYKPGKDVLSVEGVLPFSPTLDQPGVMARSVDDAAFLAAHIAHSRWALSDHIKVLPHAPELMACRTHKWDSVSDAQRERYRHDIERLREQGAIVQERDLPRLLHESHRVHRCIMLYEAARAATRVRTHHRDLISDFLNQALDEGEAIAERDYRSALDKRLAMKRLLAGLMDDHDAVLTPPAVGEAPPIATTGDPALCTLWTLLGVPAITIPSALGPGGLPMGMQLIGNPGESNLLVSVAAWCERVFAFKGLV